MVFSTFPAPQSHLDTHMLDNCAHVVMCSLALAGHRLHLATQCTFGSAVYGGAARGRYKAGGDARSVV